MGQYVQKSQTSWNIQYTADEKLCARVVTNEVQFYQSDNLSKVWNKLRVEGVADFALSPGQNQAVAVFIPERKVRYLENNIFFYFYFLFLVWPGLIVVLGSTCRRQGVFGASVWIAGLAKDVLQG